MRSIMIMAAVVKPRCGRFCAHEIAHNSEEWSRLWAPWPWCWWGEGERRRDWLGESAHLSREGFGPLPLSFRSCGALGLCSRFQPSSRPGPSVSVLLVPLLFFFFALLRFCFGFALLRFASVCFALLHLASICFDLLRFVLPQDKTMTMTMVDPETRRPETRDGQWPADPRQRPRATPCDPHPVCKEGLEGLPNAQLTRRSRRSALTTHNSQLPTPNSQFPMSNSHSLTPASFLPLGFRNPLSTTPTHITQTGSLPPYSRSAPRLLIRIPHCTHTSTTHRTHTLSVLQDGLDHRSGSYRKTLFWHSPGLLGLCRPPTRPSPQATSASWRSYKSRVQSLHARCQILQRLYSYSGRFLTGQALEVLGTLIRQGTKSVPFNLSGFKRDLMQPSIPLMDGGWFPPNAPTFTATPDGFHSRAHSSPTPPPRKPGSPAPITGSKGEYSNQLY